MILVQNRMAKILDNCTLLLPNPSEKSVLKCPMSSNLLVGGNVAKVSDKSKEYNEQMFVFVAVLFSFSMHKMNK